jgi:hypothetical protein
MTDKRIGTGARPKVNLIGKDGNAFFVLGACSRSARTAGWSQDTITLIMEDMKSGDYNHLLGVAMREFNVN